MKTLNDLALDSINGGGLSDLPIIPPTKPVLISFGANSVTSGAEQAKRDLLASHIMSF